MKRKLITILMTILCGTGITLAANREYIPMLVEGRKWVNGASLGCLGKYYGFYCIEVKGDTIVEDRTYKKVYRYADEHNAFPVYGYPGMLYNSKYHPAACLREEDGVVYKLCDKKRLSDSYLGCWEHDYYFDYDIWYFEWCTPDKYYPKVMNSTDDHYEVVFYDFNNPNGIYAETGQLNRNTLLQCNDMVIDGIPRKTYSVNGEINYDWMIVEGLGAISNYWGDMIYPNWQGWVQRYYHWIWTGFILENGRIIYNNMVFDTFSNTVDGDWYSSYCDEFYINRYDFTGDGITDVEDVNFMINNILDITPQDMKADLNMDRVIDVADLNAIINIILKID